MVRLNKKAMAGVLVMANSGTETIRLRCVQTPRVGHDVLPSAVNGRARAAAQRPDTAAVAAAAIAAAAAETVAVPAMGTVQTRRDAKEGAPAPTSALPALASAAAHRRRLRLH